MAGVWIAGSALRLLGTTDVDSSRFPLHGLLCKLVEGDAAVPVGPVTTLADGPLRLATTRLPGSQVVAIVAATSTGRRASSTDREWRSIFMPGDVLEELLDRDWPPILARLLDCSNIDETRGRKGLKFLQQGRIAAIFVAGGYHRLHFVVHPNERLATVLGVFDAEQWATHKASSAIPQPSSTEERAWLRAHQEAGRVCRQLSDRISHFEEGAHTPNTPMPSRVVTEDWITRNQLRDLGVTDQGSIDAVLECHSEEDLLGIVGKVSDEQFEKIEAAFGRYEAARLRQAEHAVGFMEILALNARTRRDAGARSFDAWLEMLTPSQRKVVTLDRDVAVRVKGGPGTGKTLTAVLRAAYLARRARERGDAVNVGFSCSAETLAFGSSSSSWSSAWTITWTARRHSVSR